MVLKDLHDALEQVALNMENQKLINEEYDEALKLANLVVEGLQHMREKKRSEHERKDEVQTPQA